MNSVKSGKVTSVDLFFCPYLAAQYLPLLPYIYKIVTNFFALSPQSDQFCLFL